MAWKFFRNPGKYQD